MTAELKTLRYAIADNVGIITLNRPEKLNAASWQLAEELSGLLYRLRFDDSVRALVLTGAGRAFCAGGDVDFLSGEGEHAMLARRTRRVRSRAGSARRRAAISSRWCVSSWPSTSP